MSEIGDRLKTQRSRAGLSLRDLAAQSGVPHSTISNWESGRRKPRAVALSAVCVALGIDISAIVSSGADAVNGGAISGPRTAAQKKRPADVCADATPAALKALQQEIAALRQELVAQRQALYSRPCMRDQP